MSGKAQSGYSYEFCDASHSSEVLEALHEFHSSGLFTDVTLQSSSGQLCHCHKVVLSACTCFKVMFTLDMRERLNDTINLPCKNGELLEALVSYVYTSKISITQNNIQSLLEATDLLQFNSLKKACEDFLIHLLDVDNCLRMHSFAELHMCSDLQREALRIILSRFEELTLQEEFLEVDFQKLLMILATEDLNVWKEATFTANNHIRVISEGSCDTEDWSYDAENSALHHRNKLHFKIYSNRKHSSSFCFDFKGVGNATAWHYGYRGTCTYEKIQTYRPDISEWSIPTIGPHPEYGLCSVSLDNKLYLVGSQTTIIDCYDPKRDEWRQMCAMMECGSAFINGCIYVAGGIERYDPEIDCVCVQHG
uniref:Kelch like family member 23 n=1 Tax=Sinocyclocheilus grahami TaxID=75366 RepID=A0A672JSD9_SINGR